MLIKSNRLNLQFLQLRNAVINDESIKQYQIQLDEMKKRLKKLKEMVQK